MKNLVKKIGLGKRNRAKTAVFLENIQYFVVDTIGTEQIISYFCGLKITSLKIFINI
ncbi:hypothetical protein CLV98_11482 [Dyadobacter jejuensis]|uniref:Uncharacterized protein n=1 Tax=Dyadobacter jejuensis TaxID=1082580 RepID=A0A316AC70_9BACT|nr:hypothetical protein CLV98_11482 [Dyadobacter jejuensis]